MTTSQPACGMRPVSQAEDREANRNMAFRRWVLVRWTSCGSNGHGRPTEITSRKVRYGYIFDRLHRLVLSAIITREEVGP